MKKFFLALMMGFIGLSMTGCLEVAYAALDDTSTEPAKQPPKKTQEVQKAVGVKDVRVNIYDQQDSGDDNILTERGTRILFKFYNKNSSKKWVLNLVTNGQNADPEDFKYKVADKKESGNDYDVAKFEDEGVTSYGIVHTPGGFNRPVTFKIKVYYKKKKIGVSKVEVFKGPMKH